MLLGRITLSEAPGRTRGMSHTTPLQSSLLPSTASPKTCYWTLNYL